MGNDRHPDGSRLKLLPPERPGSRAEKLADGKVRYTPAPDLVQFTVAPPETGLPQNPSDYVDIAGDALIVTEVTADRAAAEQQLADQQVEVVVVAPEDADS